jgi:tetratricopeptide (TPR) repeat protein
MWAHARVAVCIGCALIVLPSRAIAQHDAFVEALAQFTAGLPGTYGDEGVMGRTELDRMERGLAEWDKTLREYESNILTIGPTASADRVLDMHRAMGMLYVARGRFEEAVREFDAVVARSPEPRFHLFRGLAYEAARKPAEALTAYAAAWTLDKADPLAAYMLAGASFRSGSSPPPAALATLSDIADRIAAGQYAGERDPFIATALVPDDLSETAVFVPWWYSVSYGQIERAELARSIAAMRVAVAQDPLFATPVPPALLRGSEALRAGQVERAIEYFAGAVRDAESSEAHRMLGVAYWLSAEDERSIEHLEHAIRLNPMNERARIMFARVLEEIGETERAERLLEETVGTIPSSAMAHSRLGRIYAATNRTKDAVREYEAAAGIGVFTGETPLLVAIGDLYRRELDSERAEAALARAVALRPNDAIAHRERGRALLRLERPEAAFAELAAALLVDPGDYESYLTLGQIHLDAGRYPQAARLLTRAIAIDRDNPEAYYTLATVLVRSGRADEAAPHRETFARLQALAFEKQRRRIELSTARIEADLLSEKGQFDRAVTAWTRILADEPDVAANEAGLATALAGLGQLASAAEHYEKALALTAGTRVYRQLAALYDRMGRTDAAASTRARLARARQTAFGLDTSPK